MSVLLWSDTFGSRRLYQNFYKTDSSYKNRNYQALSILQFLSFVSSRLMQRWFIAPVQLGDGQREGGGVENNPKLEKAGGDFHGAVDV